MYVSVCHRVTSRSVYKRMACLINLTLSPVTFLTDCTFFGFCSLPEKASFKKYLRSPRIVTLVSKEALLVRQVVRRDEKERNLLSRLRKLESIVMKKSLCELLRDYYPRISEVEDLHATYIANCVFNSFLSYTAIMLNVVTIHAIRKTSSLPKTLKTLLLSLAVSDLGVGLFIQPFYTSLLIKWLQQSNPSCNTYTAFQIISYSFSLASFLGVAAVCVDRFLAIHLHLRYQELVTHKRVVAVVILIWLLSAFLSLTVFWIPLDMFSYIMAILLVLGAILVTMAYVRIYLVVRQHKNRIQFLQVARADNVANFSSLVKSSVGIFYVCFVFLVCYMPYLIYLVAIKMNGPNIVLKRYVIFSLTLVFLNSSLNPVIYCWKMRHIRLAVINILRNMSWQRSRA